MRREVTLAVLVLFALVLHSPLHAQDPGADGRAQVKDKAYRIMDAYTGNGFNVRDEIQIGKLKQDDSYYFDTQLSAGNEYFFYVGGDDTLRALDIRIYDENWEMVSADVSLGPTAEAVITPEWSGVFHIKVTITECGPDGAYWFIVSGYK